MEVLLYHVISWQRGATVQTTGCHFWWDTDLKQYVLIRGSCFAWCHG